MKVSFAKKTSSPRFTSKSGSAHSYMVAHMCDYLDETGKKVSGKEESIFLPSTKRLRLEKEGKLTPEEKLPKGKVIWPAWIPKGKIFVGGYLAGKVALQNLPTVSPLNDKAQKKWANEIANIWIHELAKGSNIRVRRSGAKIQKKRKKGDPKSGRIISKNFVFTMAVQKTDELTKKGLSAPLILDRAMNNTWKIYCEKQGWKNDSVGFVYAYHFDQNHLHLHMHLLPKTEKGEWIKASNGAYSKGKRENYLSLLTDIASENVERIVEEMTKAPVEMGLRAQMLDTLLAKHLMAESSRQIPSDMTDQKSDVNKISQSIFEALKHENRTLPLAQEALPILNRVVDQENAADLSFISDEDRKKKERLRRRLIRLAMGLEHDRISRNGFSEKNLKAMAEIRNAFLSKTFKAMEVEQAKTLMAQTIKAPSLAVKPNPADEGITWITRLTDFINQKIEQGKNIVLRQLTGEIIATKAKNDPVLASYLEEDFLGLKLLMPQKPFASSESISIERINLVLRQQTPDINSALEEELKINNPPLG